MAAEDLVITAPTELEEVRDLVTSDIELVSDLKILRALKKYSTTTTVTITTKDFLGFPTETTEVVDDYTSEQRVLLAAAYIIEFQHKDQDWDYNDVEDVTVKDAFHPRKIKEYRTRAARMVVGLL